MGAEYSRPPKIPALTSFISESFVSQRSHSGRCIKCSGHGKLFVEYECGSCRCDNQASWSHYSDCNSCNGYGRQTAYEICDDCFGRGAI